MADQQDTSVPDDIEEMKRRVKEIEAEAEKLREMHAKLEEQQLENAENADSRSIFIGNVDFSTTPEELQAHFQACGTINRVTILCDKFTGHPKGYAYVEFAEASSVANGLVLNESLFKQRVLQVTLKRTNVPGFKRGRGRGRFPTRGGIPRGRGARGARGGRRPYFSPY